MNILRQFKSSVTSDCIAQFVSECTLALIVGQLQEIKASGGGGETMLRVFLANGEEAANDTA